MSSEYKKRVDKLERRPPRVRDVTMMTSAELCEVIGIRPDTDIIGLIAEYLSIPREEVTEEIVANITDDDIEEMAALEQEKEMNARGIPVTGKIRFTDQSGHPHVLNKVDPRKPEGDDE